MKKVIPRASHPFSRELKVIHAFFICDKYYVMPERCFEITWPTQSFKAAIKPRSEKIR